MLDPRQEDLFEAWRQEARKRHGVPPRDAFDPIDFPRALPTLVLYEFVENDAVRLRVVGTEIVKAWGSDHTGDCLHEFMHGEYHDFIRQQIDECRARRVPIYSHSRFRWDHGRVLATRRLLLPFARSEDDDEIGFVLLTQVFDYGKIGPRRPLVQMAGGFRIEELCHQALDPGAGKVAQAR